MAPGKDIVEETVNAQNQRNGWTPDARDMGPKKGWWVSKDAFKEREDGSGVGILRLGRAQGAAGFCEQNLSSNKWSSRA